MRELIIPDIHQDLDSVRWVLAKEKYDRAIFLGDWFDSKRPQDEVYTFEQTCVALKELLCFHERKDDMVHLIGNHDIQYFYSNNSASQSRSCKENPYGTNSASHKKEKKFRKIFFDSGLKDPFFTDLFKLAFQTQGWTMSHAGIVPQHIPTGKTLRGFVEGESELIFENFRNLNYPNNSILSAVGKCRGGSDRIGGLLWLDWNEEFFPSVETGNQVVGHTRVPTPDLKLIKVGNVVVQAWNINTERHYGVLENGVFGHRRYYEERTVGIDPATERYDFQ